MTQDTLTCFENGILMLSGDAEALGGRPWEAHPDFAGVFLKTLVRPAATDGLFSCHLVRIEPGKRIGLHTHPGQTELHEVLAGSGVCRMEGNEMPYAPGCMAILPANAPHEVQAGEEGLFLFAKFITIPVDSKTA